MEQEQSQSQSQSQSPTSTTSTQLELILYPQSNTQRSASSSSSTSFHTPVSSPPSQTYDLSALDPPPVGMPSIPTFLKRSHSFSSSTSPSQQQQQLSSSLPRFKGERSSQPTSNESDPSRGGQEWFGQEEMDRGGKGEGDLKRAFGVKSGMKFLARREKDREQSQEAHEALEDVERYRLGGGGNEDVREEIEIAREELSKIETNLNTGNNTISSPRTEQGSPPSPASSRRKPVPPLSPKESPPISNSSPPIRPQASNSSSTPLALHQDPILNAPPLPLANRRVPPISALNQSQTQDVKGRKRNDSSGSTGSLSKDDMLRELSEGIRKERRRREMFEEEKRKAKLELEEIEGNLVVMRERFHTLNEQQELTIRNLKAEIEEVEEELAGADELDEFTAQSYLSLLSSPSLSHLSSQQSPISSFDPTLLRSTSSNTPARPLISNPSKVSALTGMKRGLNLKRRIETHLATYDSGSSNLPISRQPLAQNHSTRRGVEKDLVPQRKGSGRLRKLSRTRMVPPPVQPIFTSPPPLRTTSPVPLSSPTRSIPPRPRRPPPISGQNSKKYSNGLLPNVSTSDSEDTGKLDVRGRKGSLGGRMRKRSNSFKEGFNGTMRVLFPSNAPKTDPAGGGGNQQSINHWLRAG